MSIKSIFMYRDPEVWPALSYEVLEPDADRDRRAWGCRLKAGCFVYCPQQDEDGERTEPSYPSREAADRAGQAWVARVRGEARRAAAGLRPIGDICDDGIDLTDTSIAVALLILRRQAAIEAFAADYDGEERNGAAYTYEITRVRSKGEYDYLLHILRGGKRLRGEGVRLRHRDCDAAHREGLRWVAHRTAQFLGGQEGEMYFIDIDQPRLTETDDDIPF